MNEIEQKSIQLYVYRAMKAGQTRDNCYAQQANFWNFLREFEDGEAYYSHFGFGGDHRPATLDTLAEHVSANEFVSEIQHVYETQVLLESKKLNGITSEDEWKFRLLSIESQDWSNQPRSQETLDSLRELLTQIYKEDIHFIFELLQNAEDQEAMHVSFKLEPRQLLFRHDGKLFNFEDVNSISRVAQSTKRTKAEEEDNTKIGKFGVGFKSVYKYTNTPQVHSGNWHFKITNLVVPEWTEEDGPVWPEGGTFFPAGCQQTTFVLPFDNPSKSEQDALKELGVGLKGLDCKTLLFLRHIEYIEIVLPTNERIVIKRSEEECECDAIAPAVARHVELTTTTNVDDTIHYLRFDDAVQKTIQDESGEHQIKVPIGLAYKLESVEQEGGSEYRVVEDADAGVYVSFRAKSEESKLRYSINAAFAPSLSRDAIRDVAENGDLLKDIVELQKKSIEFLKQKGLLTTEFLGVLPNSAEELGGQDAQYVKYSIFQEPLKQLFNTNPYTPTIENDFAPAQNLYRHSDKNDIQQFLGVAGLRALMQNDKLSWVKNAAQKNSNADKFLGALNIQEMTGNRVVERLKDAGICSRIVTDRTPQELAILYSYLESQYRDIKRTGNWWLQHEVERRQMAYKDGLCRLQIVLLSDGKLVSVAGNHRRIVYNCAGGNEFDEVHSDFNTMIQKGDDCGDAVRKFFALVDITADNPVENLKHYINNPEDSAEQSKNVQNFLAMLDAVLRGQMSFGDASRFPVLADNGNGEMVMVPLSSTFIDEPYYATELSLLQDFYSGLQGQERKLMLSPMYAERMNEQQQKYFVANAAKLGVMMFLQIKKFNYIQRDNPKKFWLEQAPGQRRRNYECDSDYDSYDVIEVLRDITQGGDNATRIKSANLIWRYVTCELSRDVELRKEYVGYQQGTAIYVTCLQAYVRKNASSVPRSDISTLVWRLSSAEWVPQRQNDAYVFVKPSDASIRLLPADWESAKGGSDHPMLKVIGFQRHEGDACPLEDIQGILLDSLRRHLGEIGCRNAKLIRACEDIEGFKRTILRNDRQQIDGKKYRDAILRPSEIIKNEEPVRKDMLGALRRRIWQIGYGTEKLLFELFQNADDAYEQNKAFNLGPERDGCEFLVKWDRANHRLIVVHWGRPINKQHEKIPGSERDLENMLQMHQSDKQVENDAGVTGKFGLGFKTVFLVSDAPYILSGDLRLKVLGGYLPCEVEAGEAWVGELERTYAQNAQLPPTIVIIPLLDDAMQPMQRAWELFKERAPYLVNCSRCVKKITIEE